MRSCDLKIVQKCDFQRRQLILAMQFDLFYSRGHGSQIIYHTAFHCDIQVMWCNKASLFEFNKAAQSTVKRLSRPHLHQFTAARISAKEISRCHGGAAFLGSRHLKGGRATSRSKQTSSGAFYLYLVSTAPPQLFLKLETLSQHWLRAVFMWYVARHPQTLNFTIGVLVLNDTQVFCNTLSTASILLHGWNLAFPLSFRGIDCSCTFLFNKPFVGGRLGLN